MVAAVAGEMAIVAVDHRQAGAQLAGEVEGGDPCTKSEGREGVAQIVNAPQRRDPGSPLGRLPVSVALLDAFIDPEAVNVHAVDAGWTSEASPAVHSDNGKTA